MPLYLIITSMIIQALAVVVILFGDIGFDHGGRYGLDWDDFVRLSAAFVLALAFGVVMCIATKRWTLLAMQAVIPIILVAYNFVPH